jgi:hypothetical protein
VVGRSVEVNWATNTSNTAGSTSSGAVDASGACTVTHMVAGTYTPTDEYGRTFDIVTYALG